MEIKCGPLLTLNVLFSNLSKKENRVDSHCTFYFRIHCRYVKYELLSWSSGGRASLDLGGRVFWFLQHNTKSVEQL